MTAERKPQPDPLVERARAYRQRFDWGSVPAIIGTSIDEMDYAMAAFARDVVEECCKAVCNSCRAGQEPIEAFGSRYTHFINEEAWVECAAAPIRKLFLEARNGQ